MDEIKEPEQEKKEIIDRILKTSICFRIEIEKAETLINELAALNFFLGSESFEEMYPTLYPLQDWLETLLNDFYADHKNEYLKLKQEREEREACISEIIASKTDTCGDCVNFESEPDMLFHNGNYCHLIQKRVDPATKDKDCVLK